MIVSNRIARKIVDQIKNTIQHEINFMNQEAIIIASTDPERVDQFHEGAFKAIQTKQDIEVDNDTKYEGTRTGINAPIYFKDAIVGVIGITGEVAAVRRYAEIIKKMTEILIMEQHLGDISLLKRERNRLIIEEILNTETSTAQIQRQILDYDFDRNHVGIIIDTTADVQPGTRAVMEQLLENSLASQNEELIIHSTSRRFYILFPACDKESLMQQIDQLKKELSKAIQADFFIGVGTLAGIAQIHHSFKQAEKAILWQQRTDSKTSFFSSLALGSILTYIPEEELQCFCQKILADIPEEEVAFFKDIFLLYEKHNRSIQRCSEEIFMHKNTFQYQLNLIHKYTGYNPRDMADFVILKLAFLLVPTE